MGSLSRHAGIAATLLAGAGCDFGIVYVDPPAPYERGGLVVEGDPFVELGIYSEQLYLPFGDDAEAPIQRGLQGGTWTHPAVRTTGIGTPATVDCTVIAEDGELVGVAKARSNFFVSPDGFLELQSYAIPIVHTDDGKGPGIEDLFDTPAVMSCTVTDDEARASATSADVTLIEG